MAQDAITVLGDIDGIRPAHVIQVAKYLSEHDNNCPVGNAMRYKRIEDPTAEDTSICNQALSLAWIHVTQLMFNGEHEESATTVHSHLSACLVPRIKKMYSGCHLVTVTQIKQAFDQEEKAYNNAIVQTFTYIVKLSSSEEQELSDERAALILSHLTNLMDRGNWKGKEAQRQ
ncbi:hypothetical protein BS47DRAFT_1369461 [Hydnum rufescens UP504]|uniref:Uncharacterized protein n=1 Tax=Hydnum rufescens UP504 TaxID=1448309 RepID=A0A9P6ADV6_9AGAM|nr:hypothetical protein BS47DRAFT_1369461 [Hydnum rufescens UP504]